MKTAKKLLAITLTLAMALMLAILPVSLSVSASMPTQTLFEETFDTDGSLSGWRANSNSLLSETAEWVSDGVLAVPASFTTQRWLAAKNLDAADYIVSADVTLGEEGDQLEASIFTTGIAARVDYDSPTKGFEFQLYMTGEVNGVRLFDRTKALGGENVLALNTDVEVALGNTYNMKIVAEGDEISCYLNGELVLSYTDENSVLPSGTAGIRLATTGSGIVVTYDNYSVVTVKENLFYDDFSSYTQGSDALKRAAMIKNGWYAYTNATAGLVKNGAITIPGDWSASNQIAFLTSGAAGALGWTDYSVEADVCLASGELTGSVYAGVGGRFTAEGLSPNGYEVTIYETLAGDKGLRIYARGAETTNLGSVSLALERDTVYNVKALFAGDTISAYVDDTLVLTVTDSTYPVGYAGIRYTSSKDGAGISTVIDNFVVYQNNDLPVSFSEDFEGYITQSTLGGVAGLLVKNGWVSNRTLNSKFFYSETNATTYYAESPIGLTSGEGVFTAKSGGAAFGFGNTNTTFTNSIVETDFCIPAAGSNSGYFYLFGRASAPDGTGGYGLRFYHTAAGAIRQIDIVGGDKKVVTANGSGDVVSWTPTNTNRIPVNTVFHVKLTLSGVNIAAEITYGSTTQTLSYTLPSEENVTEGYATMYFNTSSTKLDITVDNFQATDLDYVKAVVGDVNGDQAVTEDDVSALRGYLLGTVESVSQYDIDLDGEPANIADLVRLVQIVISL